MPVATLNPVEVRQGAAHWAKVRGVEGPKAPEKQETRAATREAIGAEIDAVLEESSRRFEMERGRERYAGTMRHRDIVRAQAGAGTRLPHSGRQ